MMLSCLPAARCAPGPDGGRVDGGATCRRGECNRGMLSSVQPAVRHLFNEMRKSVSDGGEISHLQTNVFGVHTRLLALYIVFINLFITLALLSTMTV